MLALLLLCAVGGAEAKVRGVKHVVVIGLDAWGAYSVPKADMPTVKNMMENGAWTLEARSILPSSSACNWMTAMTGASPELHGYTTWGSKTPDLAPRIVSKYGKFPTIFSLIREQMPAAETGVIYEWDGIGYLFEKEAVSSDMHIKGKKGELNPATAAKAVEYIKSAKPTLAWIAFDEPDVTGHKDGHDTPAFYAKINELDGYIAQIVEATKQAGMYENTVFLLMADHGGIDKGHGGKTMAEMQVPFILFGKGVKKGHHIQSSVMMYDIASTVAWIFGIEQPQACIGRPVVEGFGKK